MGIYYKLYRRFTLFKRKRCSIITVMNGKSTELATVINDNFFYPALTVSNDKELIGAIMQMPEISVKEIVAFVKAHTNMLDVCPIELLDEKEFPDFELEKLEQDYQIRKTEYGYTKFFLEELYDYRFKEEFNKKEKRYFDFKLEPDGKHKYDFVEFYLESLQKAKFNFQDSYVSKFTSKEFLRSKKYKEKNKPVEKIDNLFSLFKCYAQGEYSKILIALKDDDNGIESTPESLRQKWLDAISSGINYADEKGNIISAVRYLPSEPTIKDYKWALIFDRQEKVIENNLQRWFDDFVPSDLDRKYELFDKEGNEKQNGATLRELLKTSCKRIRDQVLRIPSNIVEDVYFNGDIFSPPQLNKIKTLYEKYYGVPNEYKSVRKKIEAIINYPIEDTERRKKSWQEIYERYKRTYVTSLDMNINEKTTLGDFIEDEKSEQEKIEEAIECIISSYRFEGEFGTLFDLMCETFETSPDFLEFVAKEIQDWSSKEYLNFVPQNVIFNSIWSITRTLTKKQISSSFKEGIFCFKALREMPFAFSPERISKFRLFFILENWRYHPNHPWASFWKLHKKHFPKKSIKIEEFTKKMDEIYEEVKKWK